ncbi:MAG: UbiX family flavin prenyltransferase [Nitrospinota bacterium]
MKVIVAITGASGSIYGLRLLEFLKDADIEVHLICSKDGVRVVKHEIGLTFNDLKGYADMVHDINDIGATPASGSAGLKDMVVIPCSMKTLSMIATGASTNLIGRSADVVIKEKRNLVLVPRETPLSPIHLEHMLTLSRMGVHILNASPGFYHIPKSIDDLVNHIVGKTLDCMGIPNELFRRWQGGEG